MNKRERDAREFLALTDQIARKTGFGAASYKVSCLRRRVAVRMRARGTTEYTAYARVLDADPSEYARLVDALTINVTRLFRNPDTWRAVARVVLPALWELPASPIRCWVAGCASGEEAWTLAALWHELAASREGAAALSRVRVTATDIDRASLEAARHGAYPEPAFADVPPLARARSFERAAAPEHEASSAMVSAGAVLRAMVTFERRDLLLAPPPDGPLHLITCRNVIIYFDRASQDALFDRCHEALAPGGYLVLGKVETMLGAARDRFETVDARQRIFRRR